VRSTDRLLPKPDCDQGDQHDGDELVETRIMEQVGQFQELIVWEHHAKPNGMEDVYVRGLDEWVGFAAKVHAFENTTTE
jgi:ribonuclease H2 subunit C